MNRLWRAPLVLCLLTVLLAAASARTAGEEPNPAEQSSGQVFQWINFAIVAGAIGYLCLKKAPPFFRRRADTITASITQATAVKAQADRQLREAETRLGRLEQEIADFRQHARKDAGAEAERLRAMTRSDIDKVHAAARTEIEAAERAARLELKALGANLAVRGAESLLVEQLTPRVRDSLFRVFVENLEGRPN